MTRKLVLLTISLLLLSIGGTALFFSTFMIKEKRIIPVDVIVADRVGFNLDPDAMHFGMVPPTGTARRKVLINNTFKHPVEVVITAYGNITSFLYISDHMFYLSPSGSKEVTFTVFIPDDAKYGKYAGYIKILLKRRFK